jgi:hypothetical protein
MYTFTCHISRAYRRGSSEIAFVSAVHLMYVCTYVCMYVCIRMYVYVCMYIIHAYLNTYIDLTCVRLTERHKFNNYVYVFACDTPTVQVHANTNAANI